MKSVYMKVGRIGKCVRTVMFGPLFHDPVSLRRHQASGSAPTLPHGDLCSLRGVVCFLSCCFI